MGSHFGVGFMQCLSGLILRSIRLLGVVHALCCIDFGTVSTCGVIVGCDCPTMREVDTQKPYFWSYLCLALARACSQLPQQSPVSGRLKLQAVQYFEPEPYCFVPRLLHAYCFCGRFRMPTIYRHAALRSPLARSAAWLLFFDSMPTSVGKFRRLVSVRIVCHFLLFVQYTSVLSFACQVSSESYSSVSFAACFAFERGHRLR